MRSWILLFDLAAVVLFVVVGRANHAEVGTLTATFRTAAPFLIALPIGWLAAQAHRRPTAVQAGLITAAVTVVIGMTLRNLVFSEGTAWSFILVTSLLLTAMMVGWRLLVARMLTPTVAPPN